VLIFFAPFFDYPENAGGKILQNNCTSTQIYSVKYQKTGVCRLIAVQNWRTFIVESSFMSSRV
jgi:hypothetical protein